MSVEGFNRPPVTATVTFKNPTCQWCNDWPCTCPAKPREEACACGGSIIQSRHGWTGVLQAVRDHQESEIHAYWSFMRYRVDEERPA